MAPTANDADAFISGGEKVPSCSFLQIGRKYAGEICEVPVIRQKRDLKTGELKTWQDGTPQNQLVVTLATEERDDTLEDDDGHRRLYIAFKMRDAVAAALKDANAKVEAEGGGKNTIPGLRLGGWLEMEFTAQDKPLRRGESGIKYYEAYYEPPEPGSEADDFANSTDGDDGAGDEPAEPETPPEPEPPARGRGRGATATKAAPAKAAPRGRGRAAAADPGF